MSVLFKSIAVIICSFLLCEDSFGQIGPDSVYRSYFSSGKIREEIGYICTKMVVYNAYYENGSIKEANRYNQKSGHLSVHYMYSETHETIGIEYWRNGNPKEEMHKDTLMITKIKRCDRRGRLKSLRTLIDRNQEINFVVIYNKHGGIKRSYYFYPVGTNPVLGQQDLIEKD